jgi:hypothetical protein
MKRSLPETRKETGARLKLTGEWGEFKKVRQRLNDEGLTPIDAHKGALWVYPDPKWGKDEMSLLGGSQGVVSDSEGKVEDEKIPNVVDKAQQAKDIINKPPNKNLITFEDLKEWQKAHKGQKTPNAFDENTWISEHIGVDVPWESAISPGAYFLLQEIQLDKDLKKEWRKNIYAKLIPSRSVLEQAEKLKGSDTNTDELLNRLLKHAETQEESNEDNSGTI